MTNHTSAIKRFRKLFGSDLCRTWDGKGAIAIENLSEEIESFLISELDRVEKETREEIEKVGNVSDIQFSQELQELEGMGRISPKLRVEIEGLCIRFINSNKGKRII